MDYAIKYPTKIGVEHLRDPWDYYKNDVLMYFDAGPDKISVVLTERQAQEMMTGAYARRNPEEQARDLYIKGRIDVEDFEKTIK